MSLSELTPFIAGPVIGLLSLLLAYLAYRRGARADEAAEETARNAQLYSGYGDLLERIQDDNQELRSQIVDLRARLAVAEERIEAYGELRREVIDLRRQLTAAETIIAELREKRAGGA